MYNEICFSALTTSSSADFETTSAYNKNPLRKLIIMFISASLSNEHCKLIPYVLLEREPWRPQAYRDVPQTTQSRNVGTAVYHAQYNSPIGLYSDDKVLEAFKSQTGSLIDDIKG